jgi:hypothetical protein
VGYNIAAEGLLVLKDWSMAKNKRVPVYLGDEWLKGLAGLAGTFGVSAGEVMRRSLPDEPVITLFFQCKDYIPELRWDQVTEVGRAAIREHLRRLYRQGLEAHLARLGVTLASTADEVEAARRHTLEEMQADAARAPQPQLDRAREDAVYLGVLYDAWKRAKAGEAGYAITQVDVSGPPGAGQSAAPAGRKAWAVLRDNRII